MNRHGVSVGEVVRDFLRINTNTDVAPVLHEMQHEEAVKQRQRDENERRARDFFRRR